MQMQGDLKFKASMGYNSETLSQKKKGRREGKEVYFGSWFWSKVERLHPLMAFLLESKSSLNIIGRRQHLCQLNCGAPP
jgi:hypothetical protein